MKKILLSAMLVCLLALGLVFVGCVNDDEGEEEEITLSINKDGCEADEFNLVLSSTSQGGWGSVIAEMDYFIFDPAIPPKGEYLALSLSSSTSSNSPIHKVKLRSTYTAGSDTYTGTVKINPDKIDTIKTELTHIDTLKLGTNNPVSVTVAY
jgi:hypothetical protein